MVRSSDHFTSLKEEAHNQKLQAHLSYLTYRVAGVTMLFLAGALRAFIGIGGSSMQQTKGRHHHDDHHGMKNTTAQPLQSSFAFGIMVFLIGTSGLSSLHAKLC